MSKMYIVEIPPWKRTDQCNWFLMHDETEDGHGVHLYHLITPSKFGPWGDWYQNRSILDEYLSSVWDIEPEAWKDYDGPLKF